MKISKTIAGIVFILFVVPVVFGQPIAYRSGNITLVSDKGDSTVLINANQIIQEEQKIYVDKFGLHLDKPLNIYFYYDPQAAQGSLHAVPYWSAGITKAGREIHIYGSNRTQWLSTLRHELFHALLGQNEVNIPVWLNEGLAQWHAGQSDWSGFVELGTATARGKLIPLVDLDVILTFNHKRASLAYGEALDATRFLVKRQGETILPYLLKATDESFRERFEKETGEDLIDFEIAWRENLEARFWFFKISQIPTIMWAFSPLLVVLAWFLRRRRNQKKLDVWEMQEQFKDEPKYFA